MTEQSVIVWDWETIPDLAAAARMLEEKLCDFCASIIALKFVNGAPRGPRNSLFTVRLRYGDERERVC